MDLEQRLLEDVNIEKSSLLTTVKDILISSVKSLPFMDIDSDYDFMSFGLDLVKSCFLFYGALEFSKAEPDSLDRVYALRNIPLYLIAAAPSFIRNLKKLNSKYHEFSNKIKEWKPKSFFNKAVKTSYEILEDKNMVLTTQIMFAFDTALRLLCINEHYDQIFKTLETKYGLGPTIPQHFAFGYGFTNLFNKFNQDINDNPDSKLQYIVPPLFFGAYEIFENSFSNYFNTVPFDTVADIVVGLAGYTLYWKSNKENN